MATLYNPLDKFQTYSIHHVMVACRSTEDAKVFLDEGQNVKTLAAINDVEQLGDAITGVNNNSFLVVDTRKFSQFSIDRVKYETLIAKVSDLTNVPTNMEITLTDHSGISFINFVQWLIDDQMKTTFDGIVFVHRIIFVGDTPDGKTETVQTVTLPCMFTSIEMSLELGKGTYTMQLQPAMNFDTKRHARWLNIGTASRYFTGKGTNTLGSIVNNFEAQLNIASSKYYGEVQAAMQTAGKPFGRLVNYMITIPEEWESFPFDGKATAAATETIFKKQEAKTAAITKAHDEQTKKQAEQDKAEAAKADKKVGAAPKPGVPIDTNLSVDAGLSITEVLDIIFSQVKDIAALGAGVTTKNGTFVRHRHFVGITSNDEFVTVHVDVVPFEVPVIVPLNNAQKKTLAADLQAEHFTTLSDGTLVPKNYAEFDYVFTGNNKDILTFDVKIQNLVALFHENLDIGPGVIERKENQAADPKVGGAYDKNGDLIKLRAYDPVLLPRNTVDELTNFKKYTSLTRADREKHDMTVSQKYMRNLSLHYTMNAFEAALTIRGNPDIMVKFANHSFQQHVSDSTISPASAGGYTESRIDTRVKHDYRKNFEKSILENNRTTTNDGAVVQEIVKDGATYKVASTLGNAHFIKSDVFVLINVKGPKVDFRTGSQKIGGEFAELLFQNNFFRVSKVTNLIEGHKFTQEMFLMGTLNPKDQQQEAKTV